MIELPEAAVLSRQINETVAGKKIDSVIAARHPHKFAWFFGDPANYNRALGGKILEKAVPRGGMVEINVEDACLLISEGVKLKYHPNAEKLPVKHQLLIQFDDDSVLSGSVQMYGGLCAFPTGKYDNPYYLKAKEKISPFDEGFTIDYFKSLLPDDSTKTLSAKAFLATEQRIPGLGNGVLQDILWKAGIHPKQNVRTLSEEMLDNLFPAVTSVLLEMRNKGGRDTETDLYGNFGGYKTIFSKNTVGTPCPVCGNPIKKEAYMGGSIYCCDTCQHLN